jgi:hypothetical protein
MLSQVPSADRKNIIRDSDLSFMTVERSGNIIPKTAEAAIVAARTYLMATQPATDDPRAALPFFYFSIDI